MSNLVKNCWYVAGWTSDFSDSPVARKIIGEPIVLYRKTDGALVAMEDRCVHRLAPLSRGRVEGDSIRCLYHGLKYGDNGRCLEIPGQTVVPPNASVRTYPVVEKNSWVWIWMGDPARADPTRIAASKSLDDPEWILKTGQMDYRANYELINDNLLDLAHLYYVHANSFGAGEAWSLVPPNIERIPEGVRASRWIINTPPIPPLGAAAALDRVDIWSSYDFVLPGVFLLYTSLHLPGAAARAKDCPPSEESLFRAFTSQAVTPTSDTTSTYYYSWGPHAASGDESVAQIMIEVANRAFEEDRALIEAQQETIQLDPSRRPMPTRADRAITIFQKLMASQDRPKNDDLAISAAAQTAST